MLSQKLQDAINEQINKELYSEYYYLSMAAYFDSIGLAGFSNFFVVQAQEERFHAMKFYRYLNERNSRVLLKEIQAPPTEFESPLQVFKAALKHEEFVTESINNLMVLAHEVKDFATINLLNWYIDEQVEEEASMADYVTRLDFINGNGQGLLMLDKELQTRVFTPPTN